MFVWPVFLHSSRTIQSIAQNPPDRGVYLSAVGQRKTNILRIRFLFIILGLPVGNAHGHPWMGSHGLPSWVPMRLDGLPPRGCSCLRHGDSREPMEGHGSPWRLMGSQGLARSCPLASTGSYGVTISWAEPMGAHVANTKELWT